MIKLAISGCQGKMGSLIVNQARQDTDFKIITLLEMKGHPDIGIKIDSIKVTNDEDSIKDADVLIEFTSPEATMEHLDDCIRYEKAMVIGTTGLSIEQKNDIAIASEKIPIVLSPNMSVGVNLLFKLVKETASKLPKEYKINIIEAHHANKKDAPSGTAKKIAEIIQDARNIEVKDIKSIRQGEIIGDHEVMFSSEADTIKIAHSAKARDIFAKGALVAAKWVVDKENGLYSMEDIL